MVEVPKYAEVQKFAGPVFFAALAYWLLPLPDPLPRFRAWAALGCIVSGSILTWTLVSSSGSALLARRRAAQEARQKEAARRARLDAMLASLETLAPDELAVVQMVYQEPNGRLELPSHEPAVVQLVKSKILRFLCHGQYAGVTSVYTLEPVVRQTLEQRDRANPERG